MRKVEFERIRRLINGCHCCGNASVWPYGNASQLHQCRECYYAEIPPTKVSGLESIDKMNISDSRKSMEYEKRKREYWREQRVLNGIIEPTIRCCKCRQDKPVLEFHIFLISTEADLRERICYSCLWEKEYTHRCSKCRQVRENQDFTDYWHCKSCHQKADDKHHTVVADYICRAALRRMGLGWSADNMEFVRQLYLSRRINNTLKWRIRHESNHTDVHGEQRKDEEDYEG